MPSSTERTIGAGPARSREIPFFNYRRAFADRQEEYVAIFRDILRRGAFIQQRDLATFEERLRDYVGARQAIGVGNATDGLIMLWRAVGLEPGDEVILPSHTMVATASAVHFAGGTPVLVDCGAADHLVDPAAVSAAVGPRTRAICPVHLNGRVCDMDPLLAIARKHDLVVIEDAAQALGATYRGRAAGTFGRGAAFSFFPAKLLGCFGDGGAVVTGDDEIARQVDLLRDHGRGSDGEVHRWGLNSRLDNLQAAILDAQLQRYDDLIATRRHIAGIYERMLRDVAGVRCPPGPDSDAARFDVFQNYEVEAERRDALRDHLARRGIGTIIQWGGKPIHQFERLGFRVELSATDRFFERAVMLPMNTTLSDDDANYVAEAVRAFYGY